MGGQLSSGASVDYDDAPLRLFHLRVAVASSGGVFSDGYGLGIVGISLSRSVPQLGLSPVWMGLLGGASLFGLFAGALLTGLAADRFGRRPIFAYNMAILAGLSVLQGLANSSEVLLALRLAIGLLLGTDYVVSKALLTEFTPRRFRGRILGSLSVAWAGGYACAYFVGFMLNDSGPDAWRWMLLTSAVPCLLVLPLRVTMPESPLWLTNRGHGERAAAIVRDKLGVGVRPPPAAPRTPTIHGRWQQLLSPAWRLRTLVACAFFTCQVIPYFAVGTFVSQVMSAMNLRSGYVGGLFYNLSLLGGAITGLIVVDRLSRRSFLIGSFSLAGATMLVLSTWNNIPALAMSILFAVFAGVLSAASNLVYVYLPELFPTDLRASGIGLAIAASRIGSAVSTFLLPVVVAGYGVRTALGACVAVLVIGAVICQRWAPETRHVRLGVFDQAAA
ncbi:MAG TPA: MFS transporter [Steroidobacteraceae bacterium]|jgi:putative MFS transporter|nr:MFS transporter [Steroidobacteraceae bacterium]